MIISYMHTYPFDAEILFLRIDFAHDQWFIWRYFSVWNGEDMTMPRSLAGRRRRARLPRPARPAKPKKEDRTRIGKLLGWRFPSIHLPKHQTPIPMSAPWDRFRGTWTWPTEINCITAHLWVFFSWYTPRIVMIPSSSQDSLWPRSCHLRFLHRSKRSLEVSEILSNHS